MMFEKRLNKWKITAQQTYEGYKYMLAKIKELGFKKVMLLILNDLFVGRSIFEWCYLIILSSVPIILELTLDTQQHDWLGLIASWTGIVCVIFVNEGRSSNYFFGLVNSLIYLYLCLTAAGGAFYGEVITTVYFTIMQPIGLFMWLNASRFKTEKQTFAVRSLTAAGWLKTILLTVFTWLFMGYAYQSIGSNRPFRDSVTDGTNVTGQLLMSGYYWEQWLFWIATNLFSIYLWWGASIHMQGMYWVYLINSCYGWYTWSKEARKNG